jgi:phosphate transport system substrate-binding protein
MSHFPRKSLKSVLVLSATIAGFGLSQLPHNADMAIAVDAPAAATAFPLPSTVPNGTNLKLGSSTSMSILSQTLKKQFEGKFAGTQVNVTDATSEEAIKSLADDKVDIAAIGRLLTDAEKAQGLKPVVLTREKIAIIVGPENPFKGTNLTFEQFAKIFRGEITDWAEVGGTPGPIRFIDRPETSDTRLSLGQYKVFEGTPFQAGSTAKPVSQDDTAAVIQDLGKDGISYAIAGHVLNNDKVAILPMHKTLPDDPRYPYSQPRTYVYKTAADGTVNPAVQAFLGYASSPEGATALTAAQQLEAAAAGGVAVATAATLDATPTPIGAATVPAETPAVAMAPVSTGTTAASPNWWWLLPIAAAGAGFLWWLKGRNTAAPIVAAPLPTRGLAGVGAGAIPKAPEFTGTVPTVPTVRPPAVGSGGGGIGAGGIAAGLGAAAAGAGLAGAAMAAKVWKSKLTLTPRSATEADAAWTWDAGHREALKQQGGRKSMLRLYDVTDIDPDRQSPHSVRQYDCAETATNMRVPITAGDRDYVAELGDVTDDGRWLKGMRSNKVRIAAVKPEVKLPEVKPAEVKLPEVKPDSNVNLRNIATAGAAAVGVAAVGTAAVGANRAFTTPAGNRIGLKGFGSRSVYASWDVTESSKTAAKQQGGEQMQLRLYDTTGVNLDQQAANSVQTFKCDEASHDKIMPVPHPGRDYVAELGYAGNADRWVPIARSQPWRLLHLPVAGAMGGAAVVAAGAAAAIPKWGRGMQEASLTAKHPPTQRYTIERQRNTLVLDAEQQARLAQQTAATATLQPGHYTIRIKAGQFSYRPLAIHPGEPWVIIWLKGQLKGDRTQTITRSTWLTLNGVTDEYKFQVLEPTTLHAFFVDTNVVDNDGEITLAISQG